MSGVVCSVCSKKLPQQNAVGLNGRWSHVECFKEALKTQTVSPGRILRALNDQRRRRTR